jgi:hypothetical protein
VVLKAISAAGVLPLLIQAMALKEAEVTADRLAVLVVPVLWLSAIPMLLLPLRLQLGRQLILSLGVFVFIGLPALDQLLGDIWLTLHNLMQTILLLRSSL